MNIIDKDFMPPTRSAMAPPTGRKVEPKNTIIDTIRPAATGVAWNWLVK